MKRELVSREDQTIVLVGLIERMDDHNMVNGDENKNSSRASVW